MPQLGCICPVALPLQHWQHDQLFISLTHYGCHLSQQFIETYESRSQIYAPSVSITSRCPTSFSFIKQGYASSFTSLCPRSIRFSKFIYALDETFGYPYLYQSFENNFFTLYENMAQCKEQFFKLK